MKDLSRHTALVVEDSAVQRTHMARMLLDLHFGTVLEACNGVDALQVLERHGEERIFLVLTDLDMPRMDGIELIRHLTERQLTEHLIVASARDPRLLEIVESIGSDTHGLHLLGTLLKPMMMDDLTVLLERIGQVRRPPPGTGGSSVAGPRALERDELGKALRHVEFLPHFQPQVSMQTGMICGVEALARWQHPEQGLLSPVHFIGSLEGTPLMPAFTLSMVDQSLRQLVEWRRIGLTSLKVSLNLSADMLADHGFIDRLDRVVQSLHLPPEAVVWEITETMVMNKLSQSLANVARLRLKGYGLAMDDYGIGYSSIQQLSRCPFTELKIDRAFVDGASQRPNRKVILESAIEMGHRLGVTTVAEGVENEADWQLLRELGCEMAQGYLIAKPMPATAIAPWIRDSRSRLRTLTAAPVMPAERRGYPAH